MKYTIFLYSNLFKADFSKYFYNDTKVTTFLEGSFAEATTNLQLQQHIILNFAHFISFLNVNVTVLLEIELEIT